MGNKGMSADLETIEKRIIARGFSQADLQKTLTDYQNLNVVMVSNGFVTLM